jgi:hypothetical protein
LRDLSELLRDQAARSNETKFLHAADKWSQNASEMQETLDTSLRHSLESNTTPPFLSPVAGSMEPFHDMTESEFSSYTNYRYWLEMLWPSFLDPNMSKTIIAYRTAHGGELAGTTRFEDHLDDWTYADYAWGLLDQRQIQHYLLGFYGHLAYHQTAGTFTAYEQVSIKGESARTYVADYCVPSEVVTPQLLRWMLVWEPWDKNELWVSPAIPKSWLKDGFAAHHVATRWGNVSIEERQTSDGLKIQVERDTTPKQVTVYIPISPAPVHKPNVVVTGAKDWQWDPTRNAVELQGSWTHIYVNIKPGE